ARDVGEIGGPDVEELAAEAAAGGHRELEDEERRGDGEDAVAERLHAGRSLHGVIVSDRQDVLTPRDARYRVARYEGRSAQGASRLDDPRRRRHRPGARLRRDRAAAPPERGSLRPARGDGLSGAAPARGGGAADELVGDRERPAPARLQADAARALGARRAPR